MKIAHLAEMTDRFDDSLDIHLAITEEHPYNWMAWYNAGRAYAGLGLYEKPLMPLNLLWPFRMIF